MALIVALGLIAIPSTVAAVDALRAEKAGLGLALLFSLSMAQRATPQNAAPAGAAGQSTTPDHVVDSGAPLSSVASSAQDTPRSSVAGSAGASGSGTSGDDQ